MIGEVQRNLRRSLRMMLKPLVKLLINQGVTHGDFSDVAKDVYVEMAIRHFTDGAKINQSRIAVLTGLTRKEVKNVLVRASSSEVGGQSFSRPSKVLMGWYSRRLRHWSKSMVLIWHQSKCTRFFCDLERLLNRNQAC